MKKRIIFLMLFTLSLISYGYTQELSKDETLKYIENILNAESCAKCGSYKCTLEYESIIQVYNYKDGGGRKMSFKVPNSKINYRESSAGYEVYIIEDTGQQLSFFYARSITDANRLIKAILHLSKFIGNQKDPFD